MFILVGFLPLSVYAQSGGPIIDPTGPPWLSPALLPALAAFDDNSGILGVTFRITIEEADILIYKDGGLVSDERVDNIVVGSTIYYPISAFGSGECSQGVCPPVLIIIFKKCASKLPLFSQCPSTYQTSNVTILARH